VIEWRKEVKLPEASEIQEIRNACVVLSLSNKERAYDVASALKFAEHPTQFSAEDRAVKAAGPGLAGGSDRGQNMTGRNREEDKHE
jgi:hypothetical protein